MRYALFSPTNAYGSRSRIEGYPEFDSVDAALAAVADITIYAEKDEDHPGCADLLVSGGRLLVVEPV